jgi:phage/plasmid primase-like uncharacterized protein
MVKIPPPINANGRAPTNPDFLAYAKEQASAAGICVPSGPIRACRDRKPQRYKCDATDKKKSCSVIAYDDGVPSATFYDFRKSTEPVFSVKGDKPNGMDASRIAEQAAANQAKHEAEDVARHARAAAEAERLLETLPPADPDHPYLKAKGIEPPDSIRQQADELFVPIERDGRVTGGEFIGPDGRKRVLAGTDKAAGSFLFGVIAAGGTLYIAEGFSTGAVIHKATGCPVLVAFGSGNLLPLARAFEGAPCEVVIAADDDWAKAGNPGSTKAREAAEAIGARVAFPDFSACGDRGDGDTDFGDLERMCGLDAVLECLNRAAYVLTQDDIDDAQRDIDDAEAENFNASSSDINVEILCLAARSNAEYQQCRKAKAKALGIEPRALDKLVKAEQESIKEKAEQAKLQQRQNSPDWCNWPDVTKEGKVKGRSQNNISYYLKRQGITQSYNDFLCQPLVSQGGKTENLEDHVGKRLWLDADKRGLPSDFNYFLDVLENNARKNSFHPIRDYFDSLKWDGEPRLDKWLYTYFGADGSTLNSAFGRKHLLAAVRRIRQPGAKHDEILVLQGKQGDGKSSGIQALCPDPDYFTDSLNIGAEEKEVIEATEGKWIVELPELNKINKHEASHLKPFLSRQVDRARLAYGRRRANRPRQFVFIGTVNDQQYLHDPTGNRRYWPISVNVNDQNIVKTITRDRDQLWAEAAYYEATGETLELPRDLWAAAAESQNERVIMDPWLEKLSESDALNDGRDFIPSDLIWTGVLAVPTERRAGALGKRVSAIMQNLGWTRCQERDEHTGNRVWGYKRETPKARK